MITNIDSTRRKSHGWHLSEYEHEAQLPSGEIADLKADYGLDGLTPQILSLRLLEELPSRLAFELELDSLRIPSLAKRLRLFSENALVEAPNLRRIQS